MRITKKQEFISFVTSLMEKYPDEQMNEDAALYWEGLCAAKEEKEKPLLSDNGKIILKFLQDNTDTRTWTSKALGEGIGISSRSVSGSMRKLADEGFVEKCGADPIAYAITDKGINFNIETI